MGKTSIALAVMAFVIPTAAMVPTAQAGGVTITDATSDMSVPGDNGTTVIDSAHTNGDVSQVVVRHTRRSVIIKTFFADISPEEQYVNQLVRFKTSTGQQWIQRTNYYPSGLVPDLRTSPAFEFVPCADLQASVDPTANWMRIQFPRGCINRPNWFRVAITTAHVTNGQTWFDDAHRATAYQQDNWIYTGRIRKPA